MLPVRELLGAILAVEPGDPARIAKVLEVSTATAVRWINGTSSPRPRTEARLRDLHRRITEESRQMKDLQLDFESGTSAQRAIDALLRDLREILHRRGRLSGRNEALDELSKLLVAHVVSVGNGGGGISAIATTASKENALAETLRSFVSQVFETYLPTSLAHELGPADFRLKIRSQENELAREVIECFEKLASIEIHGAQADLELMNEVFGRFLSDSFIDEKQLGQYLTPPEVVSFMVDLAIKSIRSDELAILTDPARCSDFGIVLDPSCGVGSFLVQFLRRLFPHVSKKHGAAGVKKWLSEMLENVVVGIDKSERMIRLALANMAMFGLPAGNLHMANSLAGSGEDYALLNSLKGRVRLVLTNPPFGAEFTGHELTRFKIATEWAKRRPDRLNSELLFLESYLEWLRPNGEVLAIVPDNILTNRGIHADLRRALGTHVEVRTVISLPEVTFAAAGTSTKTSILHARKLSGGGKGDGRTFCAVCSDPGYTVATRLAQRSKTPTGTDELNRILAEIGLPESTVKIGRYVKDVAMSPRWDAGYHASLPREIESRLAGRHSLRVSDVADLVDERVDPRRWGASRFNYIEISDVGNQDFRAYHQSVPSSAAPSRARKLVRAGDVLVSTVRPERGTIAVLRQTQDRCVCTTGFAVLRPRGVDPFVLAYLLRSEFVLKQILRYNTGIAYPAIDQGHLLEIVLPISREDLLAIGPRAAQIEDAEIRADEVKASLLSEVERSTGSWQRPQDQGSAQTSSIDSNHVPSPISHRGF